MRDNQPKHRQMRTEQRRLARRKASREGLPSILIVCEGRETEKNYIEGLRDHFKINAAAVRIEAGDSVTDALGLVRKAQRRFNDDRGFDLAYVVCDAVPQQLAAARLLAARHLRNATKQTTQVQIIATTPSIEFWLLLHFEYSARPFRSAAEAEQALLAHLSDYRKNDRDIFRKTAAGLETACASCVRLKTDLQSSDATVPYSDMHLVVDQFRRMRQS